MCTHMHMHTHTHTNIHAHDVYSDLNAINKVGMIRKRLRIWHAHVVRDANQAWHRDAIVNHVVTPSANDPRPATIHLDYASKDQPTRAKQGQSSAWGGKSSISTHGFTAYMPADNRGANGIPLDACKLEHYFGVCNDADQNALGTTARFNSQMRMFVESSRPSSVRLYTDLASDYGGGGFTLGLASRRLCAMGPPIERIVHCEAGKGKFWVDKSTGQLGQYLTRKRREGRDWRTAEEKVLLAHHVCMYM